MAKCWKCQGAGKVVVSNATHGGLEDIPCPECCGRGWTFGDTRPPVEVPKMNSPTTCMECGKVRAIEDMRRDTEGNWFCKADCGRIVPPCDKPSKPAELKTEEKGKGKPEHFFLKAELFEKCHFCDGTQKTKGQFTHNQHGKMPVGSPCICSGSSTPGFSPVGLTVGQVERFRAERDALLTQAVRIHDGIVEREGQSPKSDAEFGLAMILDWLAEVLAKCNPGELRQIRYTLSRTEKP